MSRQQASRPVSAIRVGALLREWRAARRLSQLDLALSAGISSRHLSCVETGKAQASRETVAKLANALEMALRERNALLLAAGYAPEYPETPLATPELARMRQAIELILAQQEPYPAFLINRHWDVLMANQAAGHINRFMLGGRPSAHTNMLRQFFDPDDLRAAVVNWEEVAGGMIRHLHDHVAATPTDQVAAGLLAQVLASPGVPAHWRLRDLSALPSPLLTTVLRRDGIELRFFSTITTFATPRDVTLDELHIECCFPLDEATAAHCRKLVQAG
jgi:transcriptional regulator with XRE-family HTH domain